MSVIKKIRQDQIKARKTKDQYATLLTTVIGEAEMVGKNKGNREPTDEEVLGVIRKFVTNLRDSEKHARGFGYEERANQMVGEITVLNSYLPKQIDFDQIEIDIDDYLSQNQVEPKNRKKIIMPLLIKKYGKNFDTAKVNSYLDSLN